MAAANRTRLLRFRRRMLQQAEWDGTYQLGRKPGLKRDTKARISDRCESITKARAFDLIDEKHWETLCKSDAHLGKRDWVRLIFDQNGIGSCAAEGAAGGKAALDAAQNLRKIVYNPWFAYQETSGGRDNGSVIGDNVEFIRDKGMCPEELHPRSLGWRATPSKEAFRVAKMFRLLGMFYIANVKEFVSALLQGFIVHFGYTGHSIFSPCYLGSGKLLYANSWGADWDGDGLGVLSLDKIYFPYGAYGYQDVLYYDDTMWKPKMDQDLLGQAVNGFMGSMGNVYQPWADRAAELRVQAYQRSLQACGLAG